uniref:Uncharacterized protein n=1 Tax=viral metagenome TaxID=1070528 RepID=A0A6C0C1T1_9ZZZZ
MTSPQALTISEKFLQDSLRWSTAAMQGQTLNGANEAFKRFFFSELLTGGFHAKVVEVHNLKVELANALGTPVPTTSPATSSHTTATCPPCVCENQKATTAYIRL